MAIAKSDINKKELSAICSNTIRFLVENFSNSQSFTKEELIKIINDLSTFLIDNETQCSEINALVKESHSLKELQSHLYEFSPCGYFILDKNKKITAVNLTGATLLGIDRSRLINRNFTNYIDRHSRVKFDLHLQNVLETRCKQNCEIKLVINDHISLHVRIDSVLVNDWSNNLEQFQLTVFDISKQKQAELRFKESEAKFKSIVETTHDWIWSCNLRGSYTYCNPYIKNILGYDHEEMLSKNLFILLASQDFILLKKQWETLIKQKTGWTNLILQYRTKTNSYIYLESTAVPMFDANHKLIGILGIDRDITERKKIEQQRHEHQYILSQAARINSMDEITAILAHEINQPLSAISALAGTCKQLILTNKNIDKILTLTHKIEEQAQRTSSILHRMKHFIKSGLLHLETADINLVIQNLTDLCASIFPYHKFSLRIINDLSLPLLQIDKVQIEQVIINLIRNSIEAMSINKPEHAEIIIQTKLLKTHALISVQDNGLGFDSNVIPRLFDSDYTTKPGGVGVGLSICQTIIHAHNGEITAFSLPAGGACIEFTLPITNT